MLLLLAVQAHGFSTSGYAWSLDRMPIELHWTGNVESMTAAEARTTVEAAAATWSAALPCAVAFEVVEDPDAEAWWDAAGDMAVVLGVPFYDDADDIADVGTLIAVRGSSVPVGEGFADFDPAPRSSLQVAALDDWRSDAALAAGEDGLSLQALLAHQLGHQLGLGHSCGETVPCTDEHLDAIMAPTFDGAGRSHLGADDVEGLEAIYGGIPLEHGCDAVGDLAVECTLTADAAHLAPTWTFPDGTVVEGVTATHEVGEPGSVTVELCVDSPACGQRSCQDLSVRTDAVPDGDGYVRPPEREPEPEPRKGGCSSAGTSVTWTWLAGLVGILLGRADRRLGSRAGSSPPKIRRGNSGSANVTIW